MNRVADPSSSSAQLEAWMKLRAIEGVGDHIVLALVREWQSPDAVLRATMGDVIERCCMAIRPEAIARGPYRNACRRIARELHDIERTRIEVRSMLDANYPPRLLLIPDPPPLLYVAGSLHASDELAIAVVGARRGTAAGRLVTEQLASDLAGSGFTIVSGLARGVDAAAHRGALAAGGRTVAVLGSGLLNIYPPEHKQLADEVSASGALVSEAPLHSPPASGAFPQRNRIISGLAL